MTVTYKIAGPQFTANSSNMTSGTTVPTNAPAGANSDPGASGTYSGFGNSTPGGATMMRILNTGPNNVLLTVSNNGANVGAMQVLPNQEFVLEKYTYDLLYSNATANLYITPIARRQY
jgi:hypothetical protein